MSETPDQSKRGDTGCTSEGRGKSDKLATLARPAKPQAAKTSIIVSAKSSDGDRPPARPPRASPRRPLATIPPEATQQLDDLPAAAQVESYAVLGVSDRDIATRLRCDLARLRSAFATELALGRARRRIALRQLQWKQANEGSVNILTLLGKCELGQVEALEVEEDKVIVCRLTPKDRDRPTNGPAPTPSPGIRAECKTEVPSPKV